MDRLTQTLLGFGAAGLLVWSDGAGPSTAVALALSVGFAGVYRATRSGAVLALGALFLLGHLLAHLDLIVPEESRLGGELMRFVRSIDGLGTILTFLAVAGATVVLRARTGTMLAALVVVAAAITVLTRLGLSLADLVMQGDDADVRDVLMPIFSGQYAGTLLLASGAFAVAALGPRLEATRHGPLLCAGAIGGLLLVAAMARAHGDTWLRGNPIPAIGWLLTMGIGWALTAAAMAGLARQGSPAAWAGLALAVVEILVCAPVPFVFSDPFSRRALDITLLPAFFGLFGIAIALFGSKTIGLPGARVVGGVLVLLGALGTCTSSMLVVASDAIGLRLDTAFMPLSFTSSALTVGLAMWTAFLATLGTPPREVS